MIKGRCPKCGKEYYGWALQEPQHQHCEVCETLLLIYDEELEKTEEGRQQRDFFLQQERWANRRFRSRR